MAGDWDVSDSDHEARTTRKLTTKKDIEDASALRWLEATARESDPVSRAKADAVIGVIAGLERELEQTVDTAMFHRKRAAELADERDALLRGLEAARADIADLRSPAPPAVSAPMIESALLMDCPMCGSKVTSLPVPLALPRRADVEAAVQELDSRYSAAHKIWAMNQTDYNAGAMNALFNARAALLALIPCVEDTK